MQIGRALVLIILGGVGSANVLADASLSAEEALSRYRRSLSWRESFSMRVLKKVYGEGPAVHAEGNVEYSDIRVWCQNQSFECEGQRYVRDRNGKTLTETARKIHKKMTSEYYLQDATPHRSSQSRINLDRDLPKKWVDFLFHEAFGGMLDGYMYGSRSNSVIDLLERSEDLRLASELQEIDGALCLVLEGTSEYGSVRVWIDPNRDYAAVKYVVRKEAENLFNDTPLAKLPTRPGVEPTVRWEAELTGVTLSRIDDVHLVTTGVLQLTLSHASGAVDVVHYDLTRSEIDLSESPGGKGAFKDLMRDGAEIVDSDAPAILFEWYDGKSRPKVNREVLVFVDAAIDEYLGRDRMPDPASTAGPVPFAPVDDAYCGMYCLYAASRLAGQEVDFAQYLRAEYIGDPEGSSIAELELAARDHGLSAIPVANVSIGDLANTSHPIVLHVKSNVRVSDPDHFVLFLESHPDGVLIFDPPSRLRPPRIRKMLFYELASRWSGTGVVLSSDAIDSLDLLIRARQRLFVMLIAGLIALGVVRVACRKCSRVISIIVTRRQRVVWSGVQAGGLVLVATVLSVLYHITAKSGFLSNSAAVAMIAHGNARVFVGTVDAEKLPSLLDTECVFVDARTPEAFEFQHIPGAINLPAGLPFAARRQMMRDVPKDARVITYCDPNGCPVAARLAVALLSDDFISVQVLDGDWRQWGTAPAQPSQ